MTALDSLKKVVGLKTDEEKQLLDGLTKPQEYHAGFEETAKGMALMHQADMSGQYELGALALDNDPDIEQLRVMLRGWKWVQLEKNGKIVTEKYIFGSPAMNEDGIEFITNYVRVYGGRSISLTNYSGKDKNEAIARINRTAFEMSVPLIGTLMNKRVEWEIDPVKRPMISDIIVNLIQSHMLRSLEMSTANKYWGAHKEVKHVSQNINADTPKRASPWGS